MDSEECVICTDVIDDGGSATVFTCGHGSSTHMSCIEEWVRRSGALKCPMCRSDIYNPRHTLLIEKTFHAKTEDDLQGVMDDEYFKGPILGDCTDVIHALLQKCEELGTYKGVLRFATATSEQCEHAAYTWVTHAKVVTMIGSDIGTDEWALALLCTLANSLRCLTYLGWHTVKSLCVTALDRATDHDTILHVLDLLERVHISSSTVDNALAGVIDRFIADPDIVGMVWNFFMRQHHMIHGDKVLDAWKKTFEAYKAMDEKTWRRPLLTALYVAINGFSASMKSQLADSADELITSCDSENHHQFERIEMTLSLLFKMQAQDLFLPTREQLDAMCALWELVVRHARFRLYAVA